MNTYHVQDKNVPHGVAVKVLERDEHGLLLGEYTGYYNYKTDCFTLYPKHNPFAANNGKLRKHQVSSRLIKYS